MIYNFDIFFSNFKKLFYTVFLILLLILIANFNVDQTFARPVSHKAFLNEDPAFWFKDFAKAPCPAKIMIDKEKIDLIRKKLKANSASNTTLGHDITTRQTLALLNDLVRRARLTLWSFGKEMYGDSDMTFCCFNQAENIGGYCIIAEAVTIFLLRDMGIEDSRIIRGDALYYAKIHGVTKQNHAFVAVKMPDSKLYLIDTTYRQFFNTQRCKKGKIGYSGKIMLDSTLGRRTAEFLLRKGFIPLNNRIFNTYARSLAQYEVTEEPKRVFTLKDLRKNHPGTLKMTRFILGKGHYKGYKKLD